MKGLLKTVYLLDLTDNDASDWPSTFYSQAVLFSSILVVSVLFCIQLFLLIMHHGICMDSKVVTFLKVIEYYI